MLGYVQIFKPDLKVREYEIYQGYYCGVCKYIGREYGQLPRMALSYDAAFLACILACIDDTPDVPSQEHCVVHHIKKKTIIRNEAIEFAGDVMLILAWYKLLDDANDEGKKSAKATMVLLKRIYRKLEKKYPQLCKGVEDNLYDLNGLEKSCCPSLDQVAECFSRIMKVIFKEGAIRLYPDFTNLHRIFADIGYHMGKWIYLMDAVDDIEENVESGAYNPLIYRFDYRGMQSGDAAFASESTEDFRKRIREHLEFNLYQYLAVISEQIESLDIKKNKGIIENIVYFGMNRRTEMVLDQTEKKEDKK